MAVDRSPDALDAYLADERIEPFEWGTGNRDCMLFMAGWVKIVRALDFGTDWRGAYATQEEAEGLMAGRGGQAGIVRTGLGPPEPIGYRAVRGDVGLFYGATGIAGVICTGTMWAAKPKRGGTALLRIRPSLIWAIGLPA